MLSYIVMKNNSLVKPASKLTVLKLFLLLLVLLPLAQCQTVGSGGATFGYVDFNKVMEESLTRKEITAHSEQLIEAFNSFREKNFQAMMESNAKQRLELEKLVNERRAGLDIAIKTNNNKIYAHQELIRGIIQKTAKKRGYALVALSQRNVMLVSRYVDFTDDIIEVINSNE